MVNVFQKKILMVAVYAAEIMMKSGAEIYRVEDTVTRICTAGRISNVEVFATPTGIFVSLDSGNENDDPLTYVKRIRSTGTNLSKISKVNAFSREFYTTDLSVETGMEILKDIDSEEEYPFFLRLLGAAYIVFPAVRSLLNIILIILRREPITRSPTAMEPAASSVMVPSSVKPFISLLSSASMALYIPAPGTRHMMPGMMNMVAASLKTLEEISLRRATTQEAQKQAMTPEKP